MSGPSSSLRFVIGSRQIFAVSRRLNTVAFDLESQFEPVLPDFMAQEGADGLRILSLPVALLPQVRKAFPRHVIAALQSYRRHFIAMDGTYDDYLAKFSGKTRSTLRRKQRKLMDAFGDAFEIVEFRSAEHMPAFFAEAEALSRLTYQARHLDAGLPEGPAAIAEAEELAEADLLRAYLMRIDGKAIAYLYLPVRGETVIYAYLGYDPAWANWSPGTVLQMAALERLFAEERFRYFDFTEGEGAHKALFGTRWVEACSFYLLKPGLTNQALAASLAVLDKSVAATKRVLTRSALAPRLRRMLRA